MAIFWKLYYEFLKTRGRRIYTQNKTNEFHVIIYLRFSFSRFPARFLDIYR